jgi:N-acetylglucosaminyldiphosphoundecaprenol N-acetyl-beta-D-mannosaminyltransferase
MKDESAKPTADKMSVCVLGVSFRTDAPDLPGRLAGAGLVVAPSGPGLACDLRVSKAYGQALAEADWVIADSGLMVLVWNAINVLHPERWLKRYSGLRLIREVLPRPEVQASGASFWIMPSESECGRNLAWLRAHGYAHLAAENCYIAPLYQPDADGHVEDGKLLALVEQRRPEVIFVNVGGGIQEQLGWYLKRKLSYRPAILCTGAAIAFLTGGQAAIPPWADRLYLGWLLRIFQDPVRFGLRYGRSLLLVFLLIRYRARSPVSD